MTFSSVFKAKPIGNGNYGEVYKVRTILPRERQKSTVALKVSKKKCCKGNFDHYECWDSLKDDIKVRW